MFSESESRSNRKAVLGFIWGLSIILYEIDESIGIKSPLSFALSVLTLLAAIFLTVRPKQDLAWILLALLVPAQVLSSLPIINNHSVLFAILGVGIAASFIHSKIQKTGLASDWLQDNEPFIRLVFLVGYGAAAIAKLNTSFYNYKISCANSMASDVYSWLPFKIPFDSFAWLPVLVSATELFIFIGLIFFRTRPWALVIASVFHLALSLNYLAAGLAFNPALLSMLVFFLPTTATNEIASTYVFTVSKLQKWMKSGLIGLYGVALILVFLFWKILPQSKSMLIPTFYIEAAVATLMFALIITFALRSRKNQLETKVAFVPGAIGWVVIVVMVLNAAMPYLGGKTGATLTMYSNLRVEGGVSNHFFIPRLPIKTSQDDLVQVISSSDPRLQSFAQKKIDLNFATLQEFAKQAPNASITYLRNGMTYVVPKISENSNLSNVDPFWRLLSFYRYVPEKNTCVW